MRRAAVFARQDQAVAFSSRLKELHIESEIESFIEQEPHQYTVWVISEDDFPRAQQEFDEFQKTPKIVKKGEIHPPIESLFQPQDSPADKKEFDELRPGRTMREEIARLANVRTQIQMKSFWTRGILVFCVLVYLISVFQKIELTKTTSPSLVLPLITPIQGYFLYEYPKALELNNELIHQFQYKDESELSTLPPDGQELLKEIQENPPWGGYYNELVAKIKETPIPPHHLFEDIRKGEVWRLITPIFLHGDLLHILFNMLWLWLLGRVIEVRIGGVRYIAMILIIAAISNTLQYLASGPFFMGFSGVITGMAGFIWMRQIVAPLEVYPIHKGAIGFLWIFIIAMFLLQCLAFFLEIFNIATLDLRIANTAHLSGAVVGMLLARLPIFRRMV